MTDTIVIIPSRLAATRLPNKPLLDIAGKPMIVHMWEKAVKASNFEVYVAAGDEDIVKLIESKGGKAILTDPNLPSGTDRIYEALTKIDPEGKFKYIINLQGDMPNFDSNILNEALQVLKNSNSDIGTLCAEITEEEAKKTSVVKPVFSEIKNNFAKALYFSRSLVPFGSEKFYHHLGIYSFTRDALTKFVNLPPSKLELQEKLEQLRALENGMTIGIGITKYIPISVDTPEDLEYARKMMSNNL
ncbi:MAG: 3-deoxy-manno-octulosonate cytidylyltransferase [Sphingobacteriia bacterium]|nr:3-deoxy-manno-octulosonate cytidylyltransferase [Sphingobacteriia bacterium]